MLRKLFISCVATFLGILILLTDDLPWLYGGFTSIKDIFLWLKSGRVLGFRWESLRFKFLDLDVSSSTAAAKSKFNFGLVVLH